MPNTLEAAEPLLMKKGVIHDKLASLRAKKTEDWTDEDIQLSERLNTELGEVQKQIGQIEQERSSDAEEEERKRRVEEQTGRTVAEQERDAAQWSVAYADWCRRGERRMNPENLEILKRTSQRMGQEFRDQNIGTDIDGGFLTNDEFNRSITEAMKLFDVMRRAPTSKLRTATGSPMKMPTVDDTVKGRIIAEAAATDASATADIPFGQTPLNVFMYESRTVLVSLELIQDALIADLPGLINRLLAQRIANIHQDHFTSGTGSGQPNGIVPRSAQGVANTTGTLTAPELIELFYSVPSQYRSLPSCGWMASDNFWGIIRTLDDTEKRLNWQPSLQLGQPDRLLGKPVYENPAMDADLGAAGRKPLLFGAMQHYYIRDAGAAQVYRFGEKYMDSRQIGFMAYFRSGGNAVVAESAGAPLKVLERTA